MFASGRSGHLLGDLIALADEDPAAVDAVAALIDAVCDDLIATVAGSGRTAALAECVPGLYADRIRPAGRIDTWWLDPTLTLSTGTDALPAVRDLTHWTITANGTRLPLDVPAAIRTTRTALDPASRWTTALTQGDPTEPNITNTSSGPGAVWLDFEYAGRNTIAGEAANLLWYLLALGGWLVPLHQRDTYIRTLRLHLPPAAHPTVEHAELSTRHRHLDLRYTWPTGPGRQAALHRLLARLRTDLGTAADLPLGRELESLRPFLTARILGVIDPRRLGDTERLLLLAKIAELQAFDAQFARTDPLPALATVERP
ncbi:hypothetical protein F4556_006747 [Kitasatospora gansuensis]|uniref:Uncharacterized protein n=1 Tax=Kitasatospora gansuensis TaxID=258050 RepID=A0A7W7SIY5_9ACTN|nr:hypothetical protein [Kitasatospora gansuensis]MBB4951212.1 hypothetical protein [Kitasatospora gansuensis]